MENDTAWKAASPWHPMTDAVDLKHLGKLSEELGEAIAAVSRCVIQGIDEVEPVTGKINRRWLEDELADVLANIGLCNEHFRFDATRMLERIERKKKHLRGWHVLA
jgi:NTP pyrophosphatase (non-canonical NTP hydrolase)